MLAQQSQRELEAEVAAATAAGQAAVANAVRTHNMALAAVQSASEREAAGLKAELATARDHGAAAQRRCAELEQLRAETQLARGQLQQQLEQSWKQLEVCARCAWTRDHGDRVELAHVSGHRDPPLIALIPSQNT